MVPLRGAPKPIYMSRSLFPFVLSFSGGVTSDVRLKRGTDPVDLLKLADDYNGRDPQGHYDNSQDAFGAIRCVDTPSPTDSAAWVDADRQIRQVAPFLSYGPFGGSFHCATLDVRRRGTLQSYF